MLTVGIIVNPFAGLGGPLALKGSDNLDLSTISPNTEKRALARVDRVLEKLILVKDRLRFMGFDGEMGGTLVTAKGFAFESLGKPATNKTCAEDTIALTRLLIEKSVDVILFAGGDGTARNVYDAVSTSRRPEQPVVGIPSGVKMHSGVYAITPESAAEILLRMLSSEWLDIEACDVKDIDEELFRQGIVKAKWYGALWVPSVPQHLQQVKNSGADQDELTKLAIADYLVEHLEENVLYILGPGSTTQVIKQKFGLSDTLLGVDVFCNGVQLAEDVNEQDLYALVQSHSGKVKLIITAIGKQGHILGRGNQQLSPRILHLVERDNILVVATREKLASLSNRAFLVDTNDPALDLALQGFQKVLVGYGETLLYPLGNPQ